PLAADLLEPSRIHLALAGIMRRGTLLLRTGRLVAWTRLARRAWAVRVFFQPLYDFIKPINNVFLNLLGRRSAAGQLEPATAVSRLPGDGIQFPVLPGKHVKQHQGSHSFVAFWNFSHLVEQPANAAAGVFLLHKSVFGDRPVKEVSRRVRHVVGLDG